MNRVEWLAGRRWASDCCFAASALIKLPGGYAKLLTTLRHGLQQKPADYAQGVQEIITIVEDVAHVQALKK